MKAGLFNRKCTVLRATIEEGDYKDKEVWKEVYHTKCNFAQVSGTRNEENNEFFYAINATVTLRFYVPVEETDHLLIDGSEWRILNINRQAETSRNHLTLIVEKINK